MDRQELRARIEQIVSKYSDTTEEKDVLLEISAEARRLYDTQKVLDRLQHHPYTDFLRLESAVEGQEIFEWNELGKRIKESIYVEEMSTVYDEQRNVNTHAKVQCFHFDKSKPPMVRLMYSYSRKLRDKESNGTEIKFSIKASINYGPMKELVSIVIECSDNYPRSFYEQESIAVDEKCDDDGSELEGKNPCDIFSDSDYKEEVSEFSFSEDTMIEIFETFSEQIFSPVEFIHIITAMPFSEDEWMLDERIIEVLFGEGDEEGGSDDEEDAMSVDGIEALD